MISCLKTYFAGAVEMVVALVSTTRDGEDRSTGMEEGEWPAGVF